MLRYYSYSLILHTSLFIVLAVGIFQTERHIIPQEQIFTVELLDISDITNIMPSKRTKPKEVKPLLSQTAPKASLADPNAPEIPKPEPLVKPVIEKEIPLLPAAKPKVEEEKRKDKPKEKPKKRKEEFVDPFASVLKSVEQFEETVEEEKKEEEAEPITSNAKDEHYQAGIPLSISEKDAIRQQIMRHWSVVAGAKDAQDMTMVITITVAQDGAVTSHTITNRSRYSKDSFYRAMVDSAVRAIYKASPLQNLPTDKYHTEGGWKKMEIHFDPKEMFF